MLDAISKQSGIKIAYSNSEVTTNKNVSVNIQTSDIEEALLAVLGDGYTFKQIDDYIAIAKNENTQKANTLTVVQQKKQSVSGLLTDADGNPVIGATVSIKGTTQGVTTDIDGKYTLNNVNEGDIIEYRYIGYNTEEKIYKGEKNINIRMMETSVGLEDVVVIGYGQQKKKVLFPL